MSVTNGSDQDAYGEPKFNSTILGPDERHIRKGRENTGQNALKLSPILKDRVHFINSNSSNSSPFSEQRFLNSEEYSELQDPDIKVKKMKLEEDTSGYNSKSAEVDKENIEVAVSESNIFSETSIPQKSNSTARSHITNPFDSDIMGSLCATTYSPNLFNNSKKNVECETPEKSFRWSIGQIADFHPAVIDETESMCHTPDPVEEAEINNALNKFWASQKYVLPSPYVMKESTNSEQMSSPSLIQRSQALVQESPLARPAVARSKSSRSVEVQTMFTFPPNLDLMNLLGYNRFQHEEGEVAVFEANLSLNTLRRKLFLDALSFQVHIEDDSECSVAMADDYDEQKPFSHERPAWYHSVNNDDLASTRKVSFNGVVDANERAELSNHLSSPDISPIKN
uniref:Protein aurora borealis n=1 Tax=Elaeophora elaphi TaxID=1147741 RepID=A0A0R3RRH0_9BILA